MVQICISKETCIDIYETDGFYADISLFKSKYLLGPEYDLASLNRNVLNFIHDFCSYSKIGESQRLELQALETDLVNCQLEESDL
jgi:hypothetical protein